MRGANNKTGTGVVELYDHDTGADSKLANISTRGLVQNGDNVLIGGFNRRIYREPKTAPESWPGRWVHRFRSSA